MDEATPIGASFRDPGGFVFTRGGTLYRQVNNRAAGDYDLLVRSGLYEELTRAGLLVRHEETAEPGETDDAYKVIRPERVPFVSYPYEWCFSQLKAAALATLEIQLRAMAKGMTLRDASAYNIQFVDGRPVLIDTLSLGAAPEGQPWIPYGQFCQHFLAPLALIAYGDARLAQLLRIHIDGVPLDLAAALLPARTKLRGGLLMHLHMHAASRARHAESAGKTEAKPLSPQRLKNLLGSLQRTVQKLSWRGSDSVWARYYAETNNYTDEALEQKKKLVAAFIDEARPSTVWDLGANTGMFGRIAAERGAFTVCFDFDPAVVEANQRQVVAARERNILPLVQDLTNPSGGIGWANAEREALAARGPADLVLALALVHHLAITNNVPLPMIADTFRSYGERLVIEFVPKSDSKVQVLLAAREDIFDDYTQDGFERAFERRFTIERREPITGSERTLYLMRAR